MKTKKIVIVGGGTAGWFCAAWLSKFMHNATITLVESPEIPKIGVGESVTPHVKIFLDLLKVDDTDFLKSTGAIYKYANKFVDWKTGNGESEYFSFSYATDSNLLYKDIPYATSQFDKAFSNTAVRTTDALMKLLDNGVLNKFDKSFNSQFYYMEENTAPYASDGDYLLSPFYSYAYHINADLAADYMRDKIALPNGVEHVKGKVNHVVTDQGNTKELILEDGQVIDGDFFVDASGFHKVLVKSWPVKEYKDCPIDSAWVCQLDYADPEKEMVNYTQSIAKDYGWLFKIGLYHRMGSGYCYNSSVLSDEQAREDYCSMIDNRKRDPKLIKWKPSRLENCGVGNTAAIGLSCGFVEPMEANALYTIVTSIQKLSNVLTEYFKTGIINFDDYNDSMGYAIDDIADFILVHYTLSSRNKNDFWREMNSIGAKNNHVDLLYSKYMSEKNSMLSTFQNNTMFPDYMWSQLAYSWGVDISKWATRDIDNTQLELARLHFNQLESKHNLISKSRVNTYQWLKTNRFNGVSSNDWKVT
jgi:tryptophan halogenase